MTRLHHYVISAALMGAALATLWVTLPAQAQPAGTPATDQPCGLVGTATWSDDVRAGLAGSLISAIVGGLVGYYYGQTTTRNRSATA